MEGEGFIVHVVSRSRGTTFEYVGIFVKSNLWLGIATVISCEPVLIVNATWDITEGYAGFKKSNTRGLYPNVIYDEGSSVSSEFNLIIPLSECARENMLFL